jgi:hypothetical protein
MSTRWNEYSVGLQFDFETSSDLFATQEQYRPSFGSGCWRI